MYIWTRNFEIDFEYWQRIRANIFQSFILFYGITLIFHTIMTTLLASFYLFCVNSRGMYNDNLAIALK